MRRPRAARERGEGPRAPGRWTWCITDVKLPDGDGIEILRHVKAASPETVVIVMTAFGSTETAVAALKLGAHDYLIKPFDIEELKIVVAQRASSSQRAQGGERPDAAGRAQGTRTASSAIVGRSAVHGRGVRDRRVRWRPPAPPSCSRGRAAPARSWWPRRSTRFAAARDAVRLDQLRGLAREPAGERAVRPHEGRVHRRPPEQEGPVRGRAPGHALPGRGGRDAVRHAGEAAARAAGDARSAGWAERTRSRWTSA